MANQIIFDGDSLTVGGTGPSNSYPTQLIAMLGGASAGFSMQNFAVTGQTWLEMMADAVAQIDFLFDFPATHVLVATEWYNELARGNSPAGTFANGKQYCADRKAKGWTVIMMTMMAAGDPASTAGSPSGQTLEGYRVTLNDLIRADFPDATGRTRVYRAALSTTYADILVDVGMNPLIGVAGSGLNMTYHVPDQTHFTTAGNAEIAKDVIRGVREALGIPEPNSPVMPANSGGGALLIAG